MTITLKMHDFHVSKVSGANSVLDIYRIQPVHNWIGNYGNFVLLRLQMFNIITTFARIEVTTFTRKFGVFLRVTN